jgi:hypothetical protein
MRYWLRTLLILLAVLPPIIALAWFFTDSWVECVAWTVIPALFMLAYLWMRKTQATSRGYGYDEVDKAALSQPDFITQWPDALNHDPKVAVAAGFGGRVRLTPRGSHYERQNLERRALGRRHLLARVWTVAVASAATS